MKNSELSHVSQWKHVRVVVWLNHWFDSVHKEKSLIPTMSSFKLSTKEWQRKGIKIALEVTHTSSISGRLSEVEINFLSKGYHFVLQHASCHYWLHSASWCSNHKNNIENASSHEELLKRVILVTFQLRNGIIFADSHFTSLFFKWNKFPPADWHQLKKQDILFSD